MNKKPLISITFVLVLAGLWLSACSKTPAPAIISSPTGDASAPLAPTALAGATQPAPSNSQVMLKEFQLKITRVETDGAFPPGCTGSEPGCASAKEGFQFLAVTFDPQNLPEGDMLPYKELPRGIQVKVNTGEVAPQTRQVYNAGGHQLSLGFEVPAKASGYLLDWPGGDSVVLSLTQ